MPSRTKALVILVLLVPAGFGAKVYVGAGSELINNSLAGSIYVVFWCVALFWVFPAIHALVNAVSVLSITSAIEFLQLWKTPLLDSVRGTFWGKTLLGTTFSPSDFPYYLFGAVAGFFLLGMLKREA